MTIAATTFAWERRRLAGESLGFDPEASSPETAGIESSSSSFSSSSSDFPFFRGRGRGRERGGNRESCVSRQTLSYSPARRRRSRAAFTLIELILVMVLLAVVIAISAPSLSRFFRSRGLDSEARRFMALTRHAQSRAVSEGVPMVLWLETKQRAYGLNADKTFVPEDPKAEEFAVDEKLEVEVRLSDDALTASQMSQFKNERQTTSGLYTLRFNPDGFVSLSSPETVVFRQGKAEELWVTQSRNRLSYEIQVGKPVTSR